MLNKSQTYSMHHPIKENINIKSLMMVNLFSFFLARAFILEGIMPFGMAFFASSIISGYALLTVSLSVIAGMISVAGITFPVKYLIMITLLFLTVRVILRKRVLNRHLISLMTFTIMLSVSIIELHLGGGYTLFDVFIVSFEAFSAGVLVYIFNYVTPIIRDFYSRKLLSREEMICLSVTFAIAVSGIGDIEIWHISMKIVMMAVLVLISGYIGGAAAGSAAGVVFGVVSGLTTSVAPTVIGVYAFAGLLAGTFKELGKLGSILGFIIGSAVLNFYAISDIGMIISMEELLAASLMFGVIPAKVLRERLTYTSVENLKSNNRIAYNLRAKELTLIRLKEFSKVFGQLAATFNAVSFRENFADNSNINKLFDGICNRACKDCSFYRSCWEKDFYTTYNSMFELVSQVEEDGQAGMENIPEHIKKKCIKPNVLIETVNYLYDMHRINYKWQFKLEECRQLVSDQLGGISQVMENLTSEINMNLKFNEDLEKTIYVELDKEGINLSRVMVVEKEKNRSEIYIEKKPCYGCRECNKIISPVISNITGRKFEKQGYMCNIHNDICFTKYVEAQSYRVSTGICTSPKAQNEISGDNYTFMELKDFKHLMALSDGMGTGAKAAMESEVTINLLEQLLEAGFDHVMAVKTINSILMLKSPDDNFSTLDMTFIDLYTGDAKIIKIGAPATFIKRSDNVRIISSSSLPVGIVNQLDFQVKKFSVKSGDFIVMATDGIMDACGQEDKDKWIADILKETKTKNPQEMAQIVFDKAIECYDGEARDDMTVLVSKIWDNR